MTIYLIKMVICSGILLLAYFAFLSREKTYRYNRFYLLASVAASFIIPLIEIKWKENAEVIAEPVTAINEVWEMSSKPFTPATINSADNSSLHPVFIVYLNIAGILLLRFAWNLYSLLLQLKRNETRQFQESKLVLLKNKCLPYSFLNFIFMSYENKSQELQPEILHHELTHVRQKHSWDILFMEALLVVCWFNPFFYGYRRAIRLNHEYLADEAVIQRFPDRKAYQYLLLKAASNDTHSALTSSFNFITIKNRILMMLKTTSSGKAFVVKSTTILVATITLFLVSSKLVAQQKEETKKEIKTGIDKKDTTAPMIAWVGEPIGSTKEGVSEEWLKEYEALVNKYFSGEQSHKSMDSITEEDRARLETIFKEMSSEQQAKQRLAFLKPQKPFGKVVPSQKQFEAFKNARVYGVWIDDKKVSNAVLSNYTNSDFAHVFISKLYGAAKKGKAYTHQVDLMTKEHYKKYYEEASKNKRSVMVYRYSNKTRIGRSNH